MKFSENSRKALVVVIFVMCVTLGLACFPGAKILPPEQLTPPEPIKGNTGEFMSPYTQDDVLAEWVDMGIKARMAGSVGQVVGAEIGQRVLGQIPFVGGFIGQKAGKAAGKAIAIQMCGGEEKIKATSDLSFNSLDDLALYIYVKHSKDTNYNDVFKAVTGIYPDLQERYPQALTNASKDK